MQISTARDELPDLISKVDDLPVIPMVAQRVGEMVHDPRTDARSIAEAMRGDPALTAKVLKLVNSPYFAIPGGVSDVARAISFLGFNTLHQLVLTASVFQTLGNPVADQGHRLHRHCLGVAGAAEAIAELVRHPNPAECFTAGLLHDLGKLALMTVDPAAFVEARTRAHETKVSWRQAEVELGLPPHDSVGLRLAKRWRFPLELQVAISGHHETQVARRNDVPQQLQATVDIVLLADRICHRLGYGLTEGVAAPPLPSDVLARLNLSKEVETTAHDRLRWKMERSAMLMELLEP